MYDKVTFNRPKVSLFQRHLGGTFPHPFDAAFVCPFHVRHYLVVSISYHLQTECPCWFVTHYDIVFGKTFWEHGRAKWMKANAPSSLGTSLQRRVANPIILHHSCAIHLAFSFFFFFPTGNLWLPCWISSKPVCYDYKTLPGPPGSQTGGH